MLLIFLVVRSGTPKAPTSKTLDRLIAAAPAAAKAAGCGDVKDVGPYNPPSEDHAHIGAQVQSPPSLTTYPSVPPASGPHDPTPQGARVYASSPDIYKMIHSLEHGAVEIWYAPSVPQSSLTADENFVKQYQDHTIMSPYNYPGEGTSSTLPQGMQFALVSWQKVQLCSGVPGTAVLANFMAKYRFPTLGGGTFQGSNDPKLEKGAAI